ncbi:MAG: glycosyltransferase family 2 protein [bacterium]|nr:glycosyltransferase family 2 protein [bacterium]
MDLSIVIVSWNSSSELRDCIGSLADQADEGFSYEIILVDNASSDGSVALVQKCFPAVRIIANDENKGFAGASNQGILASIGCFVMLLNPDSVVESGVLKGMTDFMDSVPDAGACGCKLLESDNSLQYSARCFPHLSDVLMSLPGISRIIPNNHYKREYLMMNWDHSHIRTVEWVSGACLVMRREAIAQVGLLDERFFMYCEDMDWCFRLSKALWKIYYLPHLAIVHHRGASSSQTAPKMILAHHISMWKYAQKHLRGNWPLLLFAPLTGFFLAMRATLLLLGYLLCQGIPGRIESREMSADAANEIPNS